MRISKLLISLCSVAFLSGTVAAATAQTTNFGGFPQGTLVSEVAQVPPNASAVVLTVPNDQKFVLTTVCINSPLVFLSGSTLGRLPFVDLSPTTVCTSIAPGFVIPKGEVLTCENFLGNPEPCAVSGILVKGKQRFLFN